MERRRPLGGLKLKLPTEEEREEVMKSELAPDPTPDRNKISEICPGVWVSGKQPASKLEILKQHNIRVVITMYEEKEMQKYESEGIQYYAFPIRDNGQEGSIAEKLRLVPQLIRDKLAQQGPVLVHCKEGISRAPTMIVAYMMLSSKKSLEECYKSLKSTYPKADISIPFFSQLEELDSLIRKENPPF